MTLPDMVKETHIPEITDAIRVVNSPLCVPALVDLLALSYYIESFTDREAFGLKSVCWNTLKSIARDNSELIQSALKAVITDDKSEVNTGLQDLLYSIQDEIKYTQDKPMDFEFAKQLVIDMWQ